MYNSTWHWWPPLSVLAKTLHQTSQDRKTFSSRKCYRRTSQIIYEVCNIILISPPNQQRIHCPQVREKTEHKPSVPYLNLPQKLLGLQCSSEPMHVFHCGGFGESVTAIRPQPSPAQLSATGPEGMSHPFDVSSRGP